MLTQVYRTRTAQYLAAQFFNANGTPVADGTGKFIVKLDPTISFDNVLTRQTPSLANADCGFIQI